MIYLIGGPPKCGKTTLAKILSKSLGISWVSTDTLENVIKPYINKNDYILKFPVSFQYCQDNDEKYSKYSSKEIIEAYRKQSKTVYQAVDMFAICEITDGHDLIIEGYHIEPSFVADLIAKYPDKIKGIFLFKSDEKKFVTDVEKSITTNDWIIARTKNKETYSKIAKMICEYGSYFEKEATQYGFKSLNMDSNFDAQIGRAINYFTN